MAFIIDEQVFREVKAHARVIEFQTRGLSHAHCIFSMTPASVANLSNRNFIVTVILAEIFYHAKLSSGSSSYQAQRSYTLRPSQSFCS